MGEVRTKFESTWISVLIKDEDAQSSLSLESIQPCRLFTFPEIQLATHDFDESLVIGHGGFGKVYKGTITNGESLLTTAIKRLESSSNQGAVEFWAEVDMLSKLRHCHLVSLIGYCNEGQEMILVYEFMPNGTVADHLHKFLTGLTWVRRLKICIGAARGLDYLHTGTGINHGVIHRDVKSSNILLDNSWAAKISDFGLSKIGPTNQSFTYVNTLIRGTFGYVDPNYFYTGKLTRKSDVYAFGVVLFEVLCGKKAVDTSIDEDQCSLAAWAHDSIKEGRLKQIVDLNLRGSISSKCLKEFAQLADRCLHSSPKQRPTMAQVVAGLESILASQEEANQMLSPLGMKIFGKMVPAFLFPSSQENSGKRRSRAVKEKKATMAAPTRTGTGVGGGGEAGTSSSKDNVTVAPAEGERNRLVFFEGGVYSFDLEDLLRASAEVLGKGSVGTSYKAVLEEGTTVVVKRLKDVVVSKKEFDDVMEGLGKMKNENVVSIQAYYHSKDENFLVCDYFRAGSLSALLHGSRGSERTPLDWDHRFRIALSAAKGVAYLHVAGKVVHGNIKSSNILLRQDSNKDALVSDFGLNALFGASSSPNTLFIGYRAPEVLKAREVTFKSDVYSFGVLLLELLSGKAPNQASLGEEGIDLPRWVQSVVPEEWTAEVFDVELMRYQNIEEEMVQLLQIAMKCVSIEHDKRPTMQEVVRMMEDMNRAETDDGIV